jgi:hypothetical protein
VEKFPKEKGEEELKNINKEIQAGKLQAQSSANESFWTRSGETCSTLKQLNHSLQTESMTSMAKEVKKMSTEGDQKAAAQ